MLGVAKSEIDSTLGIFRIWDADQFSEIPLGVHSIDTLMKNILEAAGLDVTRK